MLKLDSYLCNHREEIIRELEKSGFQILDDLVPLYDMINQLNRVANLSKQAKLRLKWFDYYRKYQNVALVCRYFGISRKTFYKWHQRYDPNNLSTLEDQDKAPIHRRQREISSVQEQRIISLRKQYLRYGKEKLSILYQQIYREPISSWKIQKTIEKYKLYYHPLKTARIARKRQRALKKKRITELKQRKVSGFLLCLDIIVIHWNGLKRYIFTAIDKWSKVAFARMYTARSSYNARDFLYRLDYLLDSKIDNIQHDNDSTFEKYFKQGCQELNINQYYSRPRTPDDNPNNERFNRTLQEEFIQLGNFTPNLQEFNHNLTEWLLEYNFHRPHQSLNYITPIQFTNKYFKVLPMYPSSTTY